MKGLRLAEWLLGQLLPRLARLHDTLPGGTGRTGRGHRVRLGTTSSMKAPDVTGLVFHNSIPPPPVSLWMCLYSYCPFLRKRINQPRRLGQAASQPTPSAVQGLV